jgi:hypothetical protein
VDTQLQAARQARKGIDAVRRHLLKPAPESLDACAAPLSEAIGCLEMLEKQLRSAPSSLGTQAHLLRKEIQSLRKELVIATALLKAAGNFYEGYGGLLGTSQETEEVQYGSRRSMVPEPNRRFIVHG